jgi:hypothetical protein
VRTHTPVSGRILTGLLAALLVMAAPVACRKPAQPSEAYTQAHTLFGKLYGARGDEAFLDPQMDQVESLLSQVPSDSLDAQAAGELRARIQTGKQQAQAREKARNDALASARTPGEVPAGFGTASSGTPPPPAPTEETPEAQAEEQDAGTGGMPGIGTPVAQLASGFSSCFQKGEQIDVKGRGLRDRWELQDRAACRQQYAPLQEQVLIIEEGKVLALVSKSAIQAIPVDGGTPPAGRPDGGTPPAGR